MAITMEQEEELQQILGDLAGVRSSLRSKERDFVDDMSKKFEEYGSEMFCSGKQLSWLKSIHEKNV